MEAYNSKVIEFPGRVIMRILTLLQIRHENLRLAVIAPLEKAFQFPFLTYQHRSQRNDLPPVSGAAPGDRRGPDQSSLSAFADFSKQRFLWYLDLYKNAIEKGIVDEARRHKTPFIQMPFEGAGNIMQGTWDYTDLKARLASVQGQLMQETHKWPVEGLALVKEDAGIAVKLMGQHEQIVAELKSQRQVIDLSLADGNPFVWRLTYVGRTESRLEGGIIKIKIFISPRHPIEQPRVFVESPLYHIRVSKLGVMIYLPARADEIRHHIDGIINTLEDDNPPYNPLMTVNPEASALCWGTEVERRLYRRKLRASLETF
jgi:ubiquitin-conjugating enzyme E2 Z